MPCGVEEVRPLAALDDRARRGRGSCPWTRSAARDAPWPLRCSASCMLVSIATGLLRSIARHRDWRAATQLQDAHHALATAPEAPRCAVRPRCQRHGRRPDHAERVRAPDDARGAATSRAGWRRRRSSSSTRTARDLTDVDGREYIDFVGGIGTLNGGHTPEAVVAAVQRAGRALPPPVLLDRHVRAVHRGLPPHLRAAPGVVREEGDARRTRAPRPSRTPSRSPATRRAATPIVCFDQGFHGRTMLGMTLTSKVMPYKKGFGPFVPEVYRAAAPWPYRGHRHRRGARVGAQAAQEPGRPRSRWRRSSTSRCRARAASCPRRPASSRA